MYSTYINETYDIAYPLFGTGALPFPNSILTSLSVCLKGDVNSTPISITNIQITDEYVYIVLGRDTTLIGTFTVDTADGATTASLDAAQGITAYGTVVLGIVPESAHGSYSGTFQLDPSCVLYMPDSVYAKYTDINVNGNHTAVSRYIRFTGDGFCSFVGNTLTGESDPIETGQQYNMVEAINGIAIEEDTDGSTLYLLSADSSVMLSAAQIPGTNQTLVLYDGTKNFPNCYSSESDQAHS